MNTPAIQAVFPEVIDNTILKEFRACPHRFFRKCIQGLRHAKDGVGVDAIFGSSFAAGIEAARKAYYVGGESADEALYKGLHHAQVAWVTEAPIVPARSRKTSLNLDAAVRAYFAKWPLQQDDLDPLDGVIENCFTKSLPGLYHPVTGKPLLYAAKMDMAARDNYGNYVAVDEKTTGNFSDSWLMQWDIDPQMTGYVWVLQDYQLEGLPYATIRGVEIGSAISCMPVPVFRTEHQIKVWLQQTRMDVRRMLDLWEASALTGSACVWDRTLGANCVQYGRQCEYMRLCNSPEAERIAASEYKIEFWSPMQGGRNLKGE